MSYLRVNVFVEYPDGTTQYNTEMFQPEETVEGVMRFFNLSKIGVRSYVNGKPAELKDRLSKLRVGGVCFLSFVYGEHEIKPRRRMTTTETRSLSPVGS